MEVTDYVAPPILLATTEAGRGMGENLWTSPLSRPCWITCVWSSVKPWARLTLKVVKLQITVNSKGRTRTAAGSPRATNAGLTGCSPMKNSLNKVPNYRSPDLNQMASKKNSLFGQSLQRAEISPH